MVDIWNKFIQFPRRCLFCGGTCDGRGAVSCCDDCHADLPWNTDACRRCAIPLEDDQEMCGRCLQTPPPFDAALCAFHYRFPINRLLVRLKFQAKLGYARELGRLLAEEIARRDVALPEAILPVPLHPKRARHRGFNQATEIARAVGAALGVPVVTHVCERRRDTSAQSSLTADARRRNIRDAFVARGPLPVRRWAIVDDVVTTGATAEAVARALRATGAESVLLWSAARA
ncbi:MAG TPA: ComF family protein [Gammaproteobacteria bacterium]|nr:ComF family protein [Gammaproteobacteria bacterium]